MTYLGVAVGSTFLSEGCDYIDETPIVLDPALSTTSLCLLFFLLLDLWCLSLYLTGTREGTVDLTSEQGNIHINSISAECGQRQSIIIQGRACSIQPHLSFRQSFSLGDEVADISYSLFLLDIEDMSSTCTYKKLHLANSLSW